MDNLSTEQIQSMIKMLQAMLNSQESSEDQTHQESNEQKTHFIKDNKRTTKSSSKKSTKANKNKFMDMPEMNMHKEDVEVDKKLRVQPPVPRARQFSMVKVVCRVCGKKDEVSPSLIVESPSRYKCNKCSTAAG